MTLGRPNRRAAVKRAVAMAAVPWMPAARAQSNAARPIRIVSFVPTGSAADALLRAMAREVGQNLGTELTIENKPGGSGAVAADTVRSAAPDGQTLMLAGSSVMLSAMLRRDGADAFAGLTPVCQVISTPTVLAIRSDLGVRSLADLVRLATGLLCEGDDA
mgnify:CR=1 FL=1